MIEVLLTVFLSITDLGIAVLSWKRGRLLFRILASLLFTLAIILYGAEMMEWTVILSLLGGLFILALAATFIVKPKEN